MDIMGGDYAPEATTLGSILAQQEIQADQDDIRLVLIGDEESILRILDREGLNPSLFDIVHSTDVVNMSDHPTKALTRKPNSSIAIGFKMLKAGEIDGFASAGNTGAMLVGSMYSVRTIAGIIRLSLNISSYYNNTFMAPRTATFKNFEQKLS